MATTNPALTTSWAKIVAPGDDFLLTLPFATGNTVEIATTDADSAPSGVRGHVLSGNRQEGLSRTLIGTGYVWAKAATATTIVLNAWTPAA